MMLQALPKKQPDCDVSSAEPRAKKLRTSLPLSPTSSYVNSLYMAKSFTSHIDSISLTITQSSCGQLFMAAKSIVRIASSLSCEEVSVLLLINMLLMCMLCFRMNPWEYYLFNCSMF